jgi:selenoprotein W-related protein
MAKLLPAYKMRIRSLRLIPSKGGCFEITVNGNLIYSKLKSGKFPDENATISQIARLLDAPRPPNPAAKPEA